MPSELQHAKNKLVGAKQTMKALQLGQACEVYIAKDADEHVVQPIRQKCERMGVNVIEVESMTKLGKACLIDVGAAVAVVIE